jgi:hypothetical protein
LGQDVRLEPLNPKGNPSPLWTNSRWTWSRCQ